MATTPMSGGQHVAAYDLELAQVADAGCAEKSINISASSTNERQTQR